MRGPLEVSARPLTVNNDYGHPGVTAGRLSMQLFRDD